MKRIKSQYIVTIILASILLFIIIILVYVSYLNREAAKSAIKQRAQDVPSPIPTESQFSIPTTTEIPTIVERDQKPPVQWDTTTSNLLMQKINNRSPRSTSDLDTRKKVINEFLPEDADSGLLYQSPNITIDYTLEPDVFQVEITTTNINAAKAEAVKWFLDQGFSQDFICNYPVEFYLNSDIMYKLNNTATVFSPLAPSCQ